MRTSLFGGCWYNNGELVHYNFKDEKWTDVVEYDTIKTSIYWDTYYHIKTVNDSLIFGIGSRRTGVAHYATDIIYRSNK